MDIFSDPSFLTAMSSVSGCNASKYINGECGGTTRIGVLVGGKFLKS